MYYREAQGLIFAASEASLHHHRRRDRALVAAAVAAVHTLFLAWFASYFDHASPTRERFPDAWLTWIEPAVNREAAIEEATNNAGASSPIRRAPRDAPAQARVPAINKPPTTVSSFDWYGEVSASAESALKIERAAQRLAHAFDPKRTPGLAEQPVAPRPPPHFRWSEAHTQRLRRDANGNTILRINERCVIVNFLLPACAIGEIPTYADLFKDMHRAPEFGDWNDDSAPRRDNMEP